MARLVDAYHVYHGHFERANRDLPEPFRCLDCNKRVVPVLPIFSCPLCDGVRLVSSNALQAPETFPSSSSSSSSSVLGRFAHRLEHDDVDPEILRQTLRMNGIQNEIRVQSWQLLLGYWTPDKAMRQIALTVERQRYHMLAVKYFRTGAKLSADCKKTQDQISVDLPRTNCRNRPIFFENDRLRESLGRVLLVWSEEAGGEVGYFQGLNEICLPLFVLFFAENDFESFSDLAFSNIEADIYGCLTRLMAPVVAYTTASSVRVHAQAQTSLEEIILENIHPDLSNHFRDYGIDLVFFAFKWNCVFFVREFTIDNVILLFDFYLLDSTHSSGFATFHPFVAIALLQHFKHDIMAIHDTTEMLLFLQALPVDEWRPRDMRNLVAAAVLLRNEYGDLLTPVDDSFVLIRDNDK